jgi:sulfur carrier protein ThiS
MDTASACRGLVAPSGKLKWRKNGAPRAGAGEGEILRSMATEEQDTVTVETFPAWRGPKTEVPLRDGMTLEDLLRGLNVPGDTEAVMVNGAYVKPNYRLQHGDQVIVIPFMSGG